MAIDGGTAAAATDAVDTAIKSSGWSALGAALLLGAQKAWERWGSGPGTVRAKEAEDKDVEKLRVDVEGIKRELGEIRTAQARAVEVELAARDRLSRLEGGFTSLSTTVQMGLNEVQTALADIRGYMRSQAEQRHDRRWLDPQHTPQPRRVPGGSEDL